MKKTTTIILTIDLVLTKKMRNFNYYVRMDKRKGFGRLLLEPYGLGGKLSDSEFLSLVCAVNNSIDLRSHKPDLGDYIDWNFNSEEGNF